MRSDARHSVVRLGKMVVLWDLFSAHRQKSVKHLANELVIDL
jgi:hypothetical protein